MISLAPHMQLPKGTLLIANPEICTGVFFRSVVLLCEHTPLGAFGLIINKLLEGELPDEVASFKNLANPRLKLHLGGPVQSDHMMLLHTFSSISEKVFEVIPGVFLGGDLAFLQEEVRKDSGCEIHLCFGYSGWAAGQLEKELLQGHWFLHQGSLRHVFEVSPEKLWETVLNELGGRYALLAMMPIDLRLN